MAPLTFFQVSFTALDEVSFTVSLGAGNFAAGFVVEPEGGLDGVAGFVFVLVLVFVLVFAVTVTVHFAVLPPASAVIVAVPAATAVMVALVPPLGSAFATFSLLLAHFTAALADAGVRAAVNSPFAPTFKLKFAGLNVMPVRAGGLFAGLSGVPGFPADDGETITFAHPLVT